MQPVLDGVQVGKVEVEIPVNSHITLHVIRIKLRCLAPDEDPYASLRDGLEASCARRPSPNALSGWLPRPRLDPFLGLIAPPLFRSTLHQSIADLPCARKTDLTQSFCVGLSIPSIVSPNHKSHHLLASASELLFHVLPRRSVPTKFHPFSRTDDV